MEQDTALLLPKSCMAFRLAMAAGTGPSLMAGASIFYWIAVRTLGSYYGCIDFSSDDLFYFFVWRLKGSLLLSSLLFVFPLHEKVLIIAWSIQDKTRNIKTRDLCE